MELVGDSEKAEGVKKFVKGFEVLKFEKATFRYVVLEKKSSANLIEYEREFTKEECLNKIKKVISEYEYAEVTEEYEPKKN